MQTFSISIPATMVAEPERVTRMQQEVLDQIAAIPGVASAAFTTRLPMGSDRSSAALAVEGRPDDGRTPPNRQVKIISPGMFQTLGTPLVAGRDFTWTDLYDLRDVAIVSENLARELWGSPAAALGKRVRRVLRRQDHRGGRLSASPATSMTTAPINRRRRRSTGRRSRTRSS